MAKRDARRLIIVEEVKASLAAQDALPEDPGEAAKAIDNEVRERVRRSGRCNVSRAVSDLVRAGLVRRHYQGYRVDHHNRGAQREAVYTITEAAARAFGLKGPDTPIGWALFHRFLIFNGLLKSPFQ
ncbi:hypothetical protein [Sphingomonas sp. Ant H11]|uniref:hypothetical protein n=1 Tax=Sphingomonas sp. Ant H11 TaxID=1564113 RepID=UPI003FA7D246